MGGRREDVDSGVPGEDTGDVAVRCARCVDVDRKLAYSALLLSLGGRNFNGVWYGVGALEGGLNMSVGSGRFGVYEGAC